MNKDTSVFTWEQTMLDSLSEIIEKIGLGEDSTVEFKVDLPRRESLANEIAAFANAKGGVILVGVDDSGEIIGMDRRKLNTDEKTVIEVCQDSLEPTVSIQTEKLTINNKHLLKIEVPQSLFVHKSPNGYFIRQGSSKREMPTEQLARLMQSRSQARVIAFDEQAVPQTDIRTLYLDYYRRFIRYDGDSDPLLSLRKRRLLVHQNGEYRASVAGILMSCQSPERYLNNSFIQAVYYNGITKDANYQLDAKDFNGPLDIQIMDAFKFVEKYNQISAHKEIGRSERPQYSMRAVFEAIVNAVVHRDYSKYGSKIRLFIFSDRLEIHSPGSLANTLTIETLPYNQVTRNELLSRLLSEISLNHSMGQTVSRKYFLERRGEGVGIILDESKELSGQCPIYTMVGEELKLTIFARRE